MRSLNDISPYLPPPDIGNGCFVYAEPFGNINAGHAASQKLADQANIVGPDLCRRFSLPRSFDLFKAGAAVHAQYPRPRGAGKVVSNGGGRDAVSLNQRPSLDARDVIGQEAAKSFVSNDSVPVSEFVDAVPHVVGPCPGAEVQRVNAGRVVARMHDMKAVGYRTLRKLIGKAMGQFLVKEAQATATEKPVSLIVLAGSPLPASVWSPFVYFAPETLIKHMLSFRSRSVSVAG